MDSGLLLGIDVGSSSCKVGLFDFAGHCVGLTRGHSPAETAESAGGTREYDSDVWWTVVAQAVKSLLAGTPGSRERIRAVGLTGQIGTHLVVDGAGRPLRRAISWQDGRAWKEAEELARELPGAQLDELIGVHLPPGAAWPIPRLRWMKRNEPALLSPSNRWLQPKDLVLHRLTGEFATDVLSLRGLMDPRSGRVHERIVRGILGIEFIESMLPAARAPDAVAGTVTSAASAETGLAPGTPVVTGCGDFHCGLLGSGIVDDALGFNVTGTSDHIGVLVPGGAGLSLPPALGSYPAAVEGYSILYGATSSSGGMVEWFLTTFGLRRPGESTAAAIARLAGVERRSRGIVCLPYLNGERAPLWDPRARCAFIGIGSGHNVSHLMLAVLEGVAFSLRHCQDIIDAAGLSKPLVRVCGAGAANADWNRIKANVLKRPVAGLECREISCLGAAVLAAAAMGVHPGVPDAARAMTRETGRTDPEPRQYAYYDDLYACYRASYEDLRQEFVRLSLSRDAGVSP